MWLSKGSFVLCFAVVSSTSIINQDVCPPVVNVAVWNIAPYTSTKGKDGIFPKITSNIIKECCGNDTKLATLNRYNDSESLRSKIDLIHSSNSSMVGSLYYPIDSAVTSVMFRNKPYFPILESPGVTYLVPTQPNGNVAKAVVAAVLQGWPVLLLTLIMAALSGMVIWALDSYWNPEEFPSSFFKGSWEGFWWAFVTMTTVGYGDRAPRSFVARIFTFFWVLVGLVVISIFTATVTTSLTALSLNNDINLYSKNIAALNNTQEQKYGAKQNAKVYAVSSIEELREMVVGNKKPPGFNADEPMTGGLIDSFVAGEHENILSEAKGVKVGSVFHHPYAYGFVTGGELNKYEITKCLRNALYKRESEVINIIKRDMSVLPEPEKTAAEEKSSNLFDPESEAFQTAIFACLGAIVLLILCGVVWEYCYWRPKQKKEVPENDEMEREITPHTSFEELVSSQCQELEDTMISEVLEFYQTYNDKLEEIRRRQLLDVNVRNNQSDVVIIDEKPPLK